jgi:hypothetical protein
MIEIPPLATLAHAWLCFSAGVLCMSVSVYVLFLKERGGRRKCSCGCRRRDDDPPR